MDFSASGKASMFAAYSKEYVEEEKSEHFDFSDKSDYFNDIEVDQRFESMKGEPLNNPKSER
jgi:hypothetical protein